MSDRPRTVLQVIEENFPAVEPMPAPPSDAQLAAEREDMIEGFLDRLDALDAIHTEAEAGSSKYSAASPR